MTQLPFPVVSNEKIGCHFAMYQGRVQQTLAEKERAAGQLP
jgi:hypothetical protein